jgi:hypothetical protein
MSDEQILSTFLLLKQLLYTLDGAKHHVFVQITEALEQQVKVSIERDEQSFCQRDLVPHLDQILESFLKELVIEGVILESADRCLMKV